jgi:maleylacetoacetate isomerase
MRLYDYFRSSAAYRVRIALNLKGVVPDERTFVHLRMGNQRAQDYLALYPQGLVPALALDDGTVLTQSLAIVEFLDETHPQPPLLPADPEGRARVRSIALAIACEIHPLNNLRVLNYLIGTLGVSRDQKDGWYRYWIDVGFEALEKSLSRDPATGRFCHGDAPTLADVCLVPQLANARRFSIDLSPYPTLVRIESE